MKTSLRELGFLTESVQISGEYTLRKITTDYSHKPNSHTSFNAIQVSGCGEQYINKCIGTNSKGYAVTESGKILPDYIVVPHEVDAALSVKVYSDINSPSLLSRSWYDNDTSCHVIHTWKLPSLHILKSDVDVGAYLFDKPIPSLIMLKLELVLDKIIGISSNGLPILDSGNNTEYVINNNVNGIALNLLYKLKNRGTFYRCCIA